MPRLRRLPVVMETAGLRVLLATIDSMRAAGKDIVEIELVIARALAGLSEDEQAAVRAHLADEPADEAIPMAEAAAGSEPDRVRAWFESVGWELELEPLTSALRMLGADESVIAELVEESAGRRGAPGGGVRFIVVPGWEDFQHYRDRDPVWIKTYTRLLSDDAYLTLSAHQRAVLHGVWLMYARSGAHLRLTTRSLSQQLNLRVMTRDLEALNQAGFLEFSLAPRSDHARPDKRREEPPKSPAGVLEQHPRRDRPPRAPAPEPLTCPTCGIEKRNQQQLDEHLTNVHGATT